MKKSELKDFLDEKVLQQYVRLYKKIRSNTTSLYSKRYWNCRISKRNNRMGNRTMIILTVWLIWLTLILWCLILKMIYKIGDFVHRTFNGQDFSSFISLKTFTKSWWTRNCLNIKNQHQFKSIQKKNIFLKFHTISYPKTRIRSHEWLCCKTH
jgi:hypothetical protein